MGRLIPADEAVEVSVEFAGVMLFGRVTIVDDEAEATHALQLLMDKYFPQLKPVEDYRPISERLEDHRRISDRYRKLEREREESRSEILPPLFTMEKQ